MLISNTEFNNRVKQLESLGLSVRVIYFMLKDYVVVSDYKYYNIISNEVI